MWAVRLSHDRLRQEDLDDLKEGMSDSGHIIELATTALFVISEPQYPVVLIDCDIYQESGILFLAKTQKSKISCRW